MNKYRDFDTNGDELLDRVFQKHQALENLRKKLIKASPEDVYLKMYSKNLFNYPSVHNGKKRLVTMEVKRYKIMLKKRLKDIPIGEVETWITNGRFKYVAELWIHPLVRRMGISTNLLKKMFKGYFISAGNERVVHLYERLGKEMNTGNGNQRDFINQTSPYGTWQVK